MAESDQDRISEISVRCFFCYHGRYELVTRDEEYPMTDGRRMVLPRVNYFRCVDCGEEVLTSESDRYLSEFGPPKIDIRALWEEHEAPKNEESPQTCGDAEPG
jgi:YgiT-type zinc finger domain-containing protein